MGAQPSPELRDPLVEWQDRVDVITRDRPKPTRQASRLREVTTMVDGVNALAQLADRDCRQEQGITLRGRIAEEPTNPGLARTRFRALLTTSVSTRYTDRRHRRRSIWRRSKSASSSASGIVEYLSQRAAPGAQQREDLSMLLLGAVVAPGGALFELPYDGRRRCGP